MTTIVSGSSITFNDNTTQNTSAYGGGFAFRNRIINGDMRIDQRNAGASVTGNDNIFVVDRWKIRASQTSKMTAQQNAGSVTPPSGYKNYLGITSSSAYTVTSGDYFWLAHLVEGFNTADLGWGATGAATVTLSFWVRSSLTGTFGACLREGNAGTAQYPFSYTISAANTWEQKTITVTGPTIGTWQTNNLASIEVVFGLGFGSTYSGGGNAWTTSSYFVPSGATSVVGTNGATFYITGVQLEKGSTATSFDYRPYGQELALCQRYYYRFNPAGAGSNTLGVGFADSTTSAQITHFYPVPMRTNPTALEQSGTAGNYAIRYTAASVATCNSVPTYSDANVTNATFNLIVASGLTGGQAVAGRAVNTSAWLAWSAEL